MILVLAAGCVAAATYAASTVSSSYTVRSIALSDAPAAGVSMDYLAYDRSHHRVWAPAGNTGRVDVVDVLNGHVTPIIGFATAEVERHGVKRTVGPSSATVGDGVVYVGNRADSSVCAVDAALLTRRECITLDSPPDGLAYVAATREVWATTPRDHSISVIDAADRSLTKTATIRLDGQPEGFAVDDQRGWFYTNLEDRDRTLRFDVHHRQVTSTWPAGCGADGPRGLALDAERNFLMVACTSAVRVVDAGHDGAPMGQLAVGEGLDNIDYVASRHALYAAAARAAALTIARLDPGGTLTPEASVPTAAGARNAVATEEGVAYVADSAEGKLLVVAPAVRR
jgi:DNA-binding beta-propeller fold protein YncE